MASFMFIVTNDTRNIRIPGWYEEKDGVEPPSFRVSRSAVLARSSEGESGAELNDAAGNRRAADYPRA